MPAKTKKTRAIVPVDSKALRTLEAASPGQDLNAYLNFIQSIEILSAEQEQRLSRRFRQEGDVEAARLLVLSHLRFVAHIARSYLGYGLPYADLVQEGNYGLVKAVERFDADVGVRLISFASHWIKSEMHEYILQNWSQVKIATSKAQRKLFFNLRKYKKSDNWLTGEEIKLIAADLNVRPEEVKQMEMRLAQRDMPLPTPDQDQEEGVIPGPPLLAPDDVQPDVIVEEEDWQNHRSGNLHRALDQLDPRSRDIVQRRWLTEDKVGLKELGLEYGVSTERIRQIEAGALTRLRKLLTAPDSEKAVIDV